MYPYLHELLSDRTGGVIFRCFGPWHFFWICLKAAVFAALYRHLAVTAGMTAWAMLGNWVYNTPERLYNWFFVVRDPFGIVPAAVSSYVMPVLNIALFFAVELAVSALLRLWRGGRKCAMTT